QHKLAVSIGVPPRRINEIVHGKRGISADTALRLAKYFGTSATFWTNVQSHYEAAARGVTDVCCWRGLQQRLKRKRLFVFTSGCETVAMAEEKKDERANRCA
ncbi:MAG: HigA family addiction module antitoxin, partial [Cutibacterium avidum]|nr:HigA family addiction module antitoxin [Cutibacterium avidum]